MSCAGCNIRCSGINVQHPAGMAVRKTQVSRKPVSGAVPVLTKPVLVTLSARPNCKSISPRISHTSGSADTVAPAAVAVADRELVVGIGVEADIGIYPHAQATAQLQARCLFQQCRQIGA